ncbi:N-acetylmuramoyl-L-alanine amidase [Paenibacillus sp. JTLBN-2024]
MDAGHGDQDPGTTGYSKTKEKDFNLAVALKVGQLLANEPGIDYVLTRSDDTYLKLAEKSEDRQRFECGRIRFHTRQ